MIFDALNNLNRYKGLYEYLDQAIEYISEQGLNKLQLGKNEINGDKIYANVMECDLREDIYSDYEYHKHYLDLHVDICGKEKIFFARQGIKDVEPYHEEEDYGLVEGNFSGECLIDENHFAIFMLDEPHKPCVGTGVKVKKVVFKIWVE